MEESEMIKRIKVSMKKGKTKTDLRKTMQAKGYKLDYADALLKKARPHGTWFYISLTLLAIFILAVITLSYILFFQTQEKTEIKNPLEGLIINYGNTGAPTEINIDDIEITPEFVAYLLNEIGAWNLHKNPLGGELPIINFKIDETVFSAIIDDGITATYGSSSEADIQFNTNKEDIVRATMSDNPATIFTDSISSGRTQMELLVGETELFSKGYLKLYEELK